jgi:hypothetical protein
MFLRLLDARFIHLRKTSSKEEKVLNPKGISKRRGWTIEKVFRDDKSGYDLDVKGPELDDDQESIGGDNHNDLD